MTSFKCDKIKLHGYIISMKTWHFLGQTLFQVVLYYLRLLEIWTFYVNIPSKRGWTSFPSCLNTNPTLRTYGGKCYRGSWLTFWYTKGLVRASHLSAAITIATQPLNRPNSLQTTRREQNPLVDIALPTYIVVYICTSIPNSATRSFVAKQRSISKCFRFLLCKKTCRPFVTGLTLELFHFYNNCHYNVRNIENSSNAIYESIN